MGNGRRERPSQRAVAGGGAADFISDASSDSSVDLILDMAKTCPGRITEKRAEDGVLCSSLDASKQKASSQRILIYDS